MECTTEVVHEGSERAFHSAYTQPTLYNEPSYRVRLTQYLEHVERYSQRNLTYSADHAAAFLGILDHIHSCQGFSWHGLTLVDFDIALLWFPATLPTSHSRGDCEVFPSWSWAGSMSVCKGIRYPTMAGTMWKCIFFGTLVPWYRRSGWSQYQQINRKTAAFKSPDWRPYMAVAWTHGCVASYPPSVEQSALPLDDRWPDYFTFCTLAVPDIPHELILQGSTLPRPHEMPHTNTSGDICVAALLKEFSDLHCAVDTLATVAQTTILHVNRRTTEDTGLYTPDGDRVGSTHDGKMDFAENWIDMLSKETASQPAEFVGLSLSEISSHHLRDGVARAKQVSLDGELLELIPIVNVMMIGRRDRFAHRLQLGWVFLKDWIELPRNTKAILFE